MTTPKKFSTFNKFKENTKFDFSKNKIDFKKLFEFKFFQNFIDFLKNNSASTIALIETLLGLIFFLTIKYPQIFLGISFFTQRYFSILIMILAILLSYIFAFYIRKNTDFWSAFGVWAQSTILIFYSFAYYLRLNNNNIRIFDQEFTTGLIFVPLSLLIFYFHYNLFDENKRVFWLIFAQVMLILIYTFSFVDFLRVDNTFDRNFTQSWLDWIFAWPSWVWIFISSAIISYISFCNLVLEKGVKLNFIVISFILILQALILIYFFGESSYWKKTLLSLVVWNYLIVNLAPIAQKTRDDNYKPKLIFVSIYHSVLFFCTFFFI